MVVNGRSNGNGNGYHANGNGNAYSNGNGNGHSNGNGNGHRVLPQALAEFDVDEFDLRDGAITIIDDDVHVILRRSDEVDVDALRHTEAQAQ
jgi:hypothetical protein